MSPGNQTQVMVCWSLAAPSEAEPQPPFMAAPSEAEPWPPPWPPAPSEAEP